MSHLSHCLDEDCRGIEPTSNLNRRRFLSRGGILAASVACGGATGLASATRLRAQAPAASAPASLVDPTSEPIARPGATPNTRFAVNVEMWFGRRTFLDKIKMAAEFGFPAIEFWPYDNKPLKEAAELLRERQVAVAQFTAWGFGTKLNHPDSDHEDFRRAIDASCDVADMLNCSLFTVVIGNDIPGVSKEQMHAAAIRGLKKVAALCEQRKKTIIIEPMNPRDHPNHCLYGSEDAINICKAVGSPSVKINWDLYHMQIFEGDLCMTMRRGFDYIGYLQLADNPGRHEPGTGEVNYTRVFREMKQLGYTDYVGLECRPQQDDRTAAERIHRADRWS